MKTQYKQFGVIYKTTNLLNGMIYIGKHEGEFNHTYLGSGNLIIKAIKKYGKKNFSVKEIVSCNSEEDLNATEIRLIRLHRKLLGSFRLYNIAEGGEGGRGTLVGGRHTLESKLKMGKSHKGCTAWNKGLKLSDLGYVSPSKGQKHSEARKRKNSEGHKGLSYPTRGKNSKPAWNKGLKLSQLGYVSPLIGLKRSEESKEKNRQAHLGKVMGKQSPEHLLERIQARMKTCALKKLLSAEVESLGY